MWGGPGGTKCGADQVGKGLEQTRVKEQGLAVMRCNSVELNVCGCFPSPPLPCERMDFCPPFVYRIKLMVIGHVHVPPNHPAPQDQCSFNGAWRGKAPAGGKPRTYYVSSYFWDRAQVI